MQFEWFRTIYGKDGMHRTPYMTRLVLGPFRLHIFHRGDNDPDPHDHPWEFWTFPLTSYVEEVYADNGAGYVKQEGFRRCVPAFWLHYREANYTHRVLGRCGKDFDSRFEHRPGKIISIVWAGKPRGRNRDWGFWEMPRNPAHVLSRVFVPWKAYVYGQPRDKRLDVV